MSAEDGAWVAACNSWDGAHVMSRLEELVRAAAAEMEDDSRGGPRVTFNAYLDVSPQRIVMEARPRVAGSFARQAELVVETYVRFVLVDHNLVVQLEEQASEGNELAMKALPKEPGTIEATCSQATLSDTVPLEPLVARPALDCRTGAPCLVFEGRPVTVEAFARRAMLPALFPDLVAVDQSKQLA